MAEPEPETKSKSAFADTRTTIKSLLAAVGIGLAIGFVAACIKASREVDMRATYLGLDGLWWPIITVVLSVVAAGVTIAVLRPRRRTVVVIFGIVAVCGGVFRSLVRIDSFYGNMIPRLAWRWQPSAESEFDRYRSSVVPGEPPSIDTAAPEVKLTATERDHAGFLGQHRDGTVAGVRLEPNWVLHPPRELWRHPIGTGWAGFAVMDEAAITMEQRGDQEAIVCYNLHTGTELWSHEEKVRFVDGHGDGPRTTPTISDGNVYCFGATGVLTCLDGVSGKRIWRRDTLEDPQKSNLEWGMSGSPLLVAGQVIVTPGGGSGRAIMSFRVEDGSPVWSHGDDAAAYASPAMVELAGTQQLLSFNGVGLRGYDDRGHELWIHPWVTQGELQRVNVAQPIVVSPAGFDSKLAGYVVVSSGYDEGAALLKVEQSGGRWSVSEVWKSRNLKAKMSNFVVRDQFIYGLDNGIMTCLSLQDGKKLWKGGRYGHGQILLVDDMVLVQAESGEVILVEATPDEHRELGRFAALPGKTWNHAALAGNILVVRNDGEAAAYELALRTTPMH